MYKSSGVLVIDAFPLRQVDGEVIDSLVNSMEEGLLYILVIQGLNEYKSPFSFYQVDNWVSTIVNSPRVITVDVPLLIKDSNDSSNIMLNISKVLSNLNNLPHTEPLNELCCYDSSLEETNPYVIGVKKCFKEHHVLNLEGLEGNISRKDILNEMLKVSKDKLDDYFNLLTPKSYRSVVNYIQSLN